MSQRKEFRLDFKKGTLARSHRDIHGPSFTERFEKVGMWAVKLGLAVTILLALNLMFDRPFF